MDKNAKASLLERSIWKKSEARKYTGLSIYIMNGLYKQMKELPTFKGCIYRDELLKLLHTTYKKEREKYDQNLFE